MTTVTMVMWMAKGAVVLASATLATLLLGRAPASVRHLVWTAALAAALALPVFERSGLVPRVAVPAGWLPVEATLSALSVAANSTGASARGTSVSRNTAERARTAAAVADLVEERATGSQAEGARARVRTAETRPERDAALDVPRAVATSSEGGAATAFERDASTPVERDASLASVGAEPFRPAAWPTVLVAVWLAGALGLLGLTVRSNFAAWRLTHRKARPAPPDAQRTLDRLAGEMGIRGRVRLVVADVRVPATWGLVAGSVVLPEGYRSWSTTTLEHVLLHELAHVRRRDCLGHLVGEVARAVRWYDPLAWLAVHRQRVESERACDDRVLQHGRAASAYAEDLLRLVGALRSSGGTPPRAALAMARRSRLAGRLGAILDARRARGPVRPAVAASVGAAVLALTLSAAGAEPETAAQDEAGQEAAAVVRTPDDGVAMPATRTQDVGEPAAATRTDDVGEPVAVPRAQDGGAEPAPPFVSPPFRPTPLVSDPLRELPVVVGLLPQSQELCVFRDSENRSTSIHMDDDVTRIRWETDSCRVEIDLEGDVEFTADDTGVARMAENALFEIQERVGDDERRARFEGMEGGGIERRYWVDGDEVPWGPEADGWIAQVLPELFRHTTINAEARVRRMVARGGPEAVFDEVALMRSDHVASTYLELLMDAAELGEPDLIRVIEFAGQLDSDHTSAELLLSVVAQAGLRPGFQDPLLRAAEGLESDHEKGRVLGTLLESPELSPAQLDAVVRSAATIESDHGLSEVLSAVARRGDLDATGRSAFLETLATVESDHSQGSVVDAFLDLGPLSGEELSAVLALTRGIESDHERGRILQRVARDHELTGTQATAYLASARAIESDHESGSTARVIVERATFSSEHLGLVLSIAEGVESDHERGGILQAVVDRRALEPSETLRLIEVASGIESDHQRSATLEHVVREQDLDDAAVLAVMESAAGIGSDHNQSQVLLTLAERFTLDGRALERYRELAERLGRQYEDRLLAALVR